ncbi:MAG: EamA family transporter [Bacillota bacterium]
MDREERKVLLAYLCVCIVWGSTYLAIRIGVSQFPPMAFAGIRFIAAGALMLLYARFKGLPLPDSTGDVKKLGIVGLFLLLGGNGLVVWAEQWVHSGLACLLVATVPLFMALLELMMPNANKIGKKGWIGLIIGFAGVVLLVLSGSGTGAIDMLGAGLLLLAAFLWSSGSVLSKTFQPSGSIVSHIGIEMLSGGFGLCLVGLLLGEFSRIHITTTGIGALLYLIFFGSILGYSSYIYILQKWPAAKAGTYAYVNPPVAVFLGAIFLDEPVTIFVVISTVIILVGVFLVQASKVQTVKSPNSDGETV